MGPPRLLPESPVYPWALGMDRAPPCHLERRGAGACRSRCHAPARVAQRRKTRLRRETGAKASVSYGIPSEVGLPASISRRRASSRSGCVRNPRSGANPSTRKAGPPTRGRPASFNAVAQQSVRRLLRYASPPSPSAAPVVAAAAAARSAARFLWLRQPVQNTSAIRPMETTFTAMVTLVITCMPGT